MSMFAGYPAIHHPESRVSGAVLKWIAIITMFCDHLSVAVLMPLWHTSVSIYDFDTIQAFPAALRAKLWLCVALRYIGRLAFPIFCFLLAEGLTHTRNRWRYAARLAAFACVSELLFDLAIYGRWFTGGQNVFFTLLIGLLTCMALDEAARRWPQLRMPVQIGILLAGYALAEWGLRTDYGGFGVVFICVLYLLRHARLWECIGGAVSIGFEITSVLAFIPIYFYNGTRGRQPKWFFYWFYPLHLALLYALRLTLM